MKFGKRLAAEAARRWRSHYLDYKVVKKAIQDDVAALGETCLHALNSNSFFPDRFALPCRGF